MKTLFTLTAVLISLLSLGQTQFVTLASNKLPVPALCKVESELKVCCDDYEVGWLYGDRQKVKGLQDSFLELSGMFGNAKKQRTDFYLFDKKVKGYKVSYQSDSKTVYQLTASGVVNNEPVWILISLAKDPVTNDDLPQFVRQIIRISEK